MRVCVFKSSRLADEWHFIFRFRNSTYLFSRVPCRNVFSKFVLALTRHSKEQRVFAYDAEGLKDICEYEFGWFPANTVDARELARQNGTHDSFEDLAKAVAGGNYCSRAGRLSSIAQPSLVAMHHLDVDAPVLYHFCVRSLHLSGAEWSDYARDSAEENERKARERDRQSRRQPENNPRSRSRHH